jgi:hypothetical protein
MPVQQCCASAVLIQNILKTGLAGKTGAVWQICERRAHLPACWCQKVWQLKGVAADCDLPDYVLAPLMQLQHIVSNTCDAGSQANMVSVQLRNRSKLQQALPVQAVHRGRAEAV